MDHLTFKDFLRTIDEDTAMDISKIQADISMIDTQINQRVAPLQTKKMSLLKALALKQRQQQQETKRTSAQQPQQQPQPAQQQAPAQQGQAPALPGQQAPGQA